MKNSDLKAETEGRTCAAQAQALRTSYIKFNIDKTVESPQCRMCGEKGESVGDYVGNMAWGEQLIGMIMALKELWNLMR